MEGKNNNGIIVILGLIILCLVGYIVYTDFIAKDAEPKSVESVQSTSQEESSISGGEKTTSVVGVYSLTDNYVVGGSEQLDRKTTLSLCENNMYIFKLLVLSKPGVTDGGQHGSVTSIGTYKVENNKVYLYQLFEIEPGGGEYKEETFVVEFDSENDIKLPETILNNFLSEDGKNDISLPKTGEQEAAKNSEKDISEGIKGYIDMVKAGL